MLYDYFADNYPVIRAKNRWVACLTCPASLEYCGIAAHGQGSPLSHRRVQRGTCILWKSWNQDT